MDFATKMQLRRTGGFLCHTKGCNGVVFDGPCGGRIDLKICGACWDVERERIQAEEERERKLAQDRKARNCDIDELENMDMFIVRARHEGWWDYQQEMEARDGPEWGWAELERRKLQLRHWSKDTTSQRMPARRALASEALQKTATHGKVTIWVPDEKIMKVYQDMLGGHPGVEVKVGHGHGGSSSMVDPYYAHNGGQR